jgi:hypothetical protein
MATSTLEEMQTQLARTVCPSCRAKALDLRLRCDLGQDECLYLVTCGSCTSDFVIGAESKALAQHRPAVDALLSSLSCPTCAGAKLELSFQCELATKRCFYAVVCRSCRQVVKTYR